MLSSQWWGVPLLLSLSSLTACLPQTAPPAPPSTAVTVKNMTVYGTGCPIGGGPISQSTKGGAPVFVFREWGLSLPDTDETPEEAEKWCVEQITLGDGPVGMQLRVKSITIGGWADIDADTKISLSVQTNLGGKAAGAATITIGKDKLKDNDFEETFDTKPDTGDVWSACVPASGDVPQLSIRIGAGLIGAKRADGTFSGGTLGGNSTDMARGLRVNFTPVWQQCATP
ncbi:hypothetical protein QBC34DRAFT_363024 [Podospora aff. communis PSN243]|uniref:Lipoprotein n=1 Tax=Podospora aff. communis PSN243 TaxID=3040156 RepID=A0AAV9G233_9PEZI|nr:hypothetical protein QBC34DRAFT_363024 [Podospora aff. communis PSN243]